SRPKSVRDFGGLHPLLLPVSDAVPSDLVAVADAPLGHVEPVARHAVVAGGQQTVLLMPDVSGIGDTKVETAGFVEALAPTIGSSLGDDFLHLCAPPLAHPRQDQSAERENVLPVGELPAPQRLPVGWHRRRALASVHLTANESVD